MQIILFNKPFNVLCQFTGPGKRLTLADYITVPGIYAAGRLAYEDEGLLILTDTGRIQKRIIDPRTNLVSTYWAQVEGIASADCLQRLAHTFQLEVEGVGPVSVLPIKPPAVWSRNPSFAERLQTSWLAITMTDERNLQVRQNLAAVGLTTVRLIRQAVGPWTLGKLQPGEWKVATFPPQWLEQPAEVL